MLRYSYDLNFSNYNQKIIKNNKTENKINNELLSKWNSESKF